MENKKWTCDGHGKTGGTGIIYLSSSLKTEKNIHWLKKTQHYPCL